MPGIDLIQDFGVLLLAAGISGSLCRRLGLSVIVGYLLAGIVIGPHTPPFSLVSDEARIMALSQVGLVFLMFSIGLGLSLSRFARMGAGTLVATATGALIILLLTELAGTLAGWTMLQAMFVAAMLMVSSSAVIAKIVSELKLSHERTSQVALAVTVLEDVVAVMMLTILASQVRAGDNEDVGRLLGGLSAFVALLVGAGLLLVPRLLRRLEARADPEMQTVIVVGLLFALALAATKAGYSIALGAFLFGAIVAEIPQKRSVETEFAGLRDVFTSVFFVSIGMLIDLRLVLEVWPMILAVTVFALVARPVACSLALILVGTPPADARRSSLLLTPLGEFSFIIAQLGISSAVLPASYYPIAVGASILTILAAPLMNRHRDGILGVVDRIEPRWMKRTLAAYHAWVVQLGEQPGQPSLWTLLRPRFLQVLLEVLFISGLLIFSEALLEAIATSAIGSELEPTTLAYSFWGFVTILVLVPLVAIWRNCSALAMLMAESWGSSWLPGRVIERVLNAGILIALASWLYFVLPLETFTEWGWAVLAAGAAAVVAIFSRRLIYWHSQWQTSVQEVLADDPRSESERREQARANLGRSLGDWNVVLADFVVPDAAAYAGKTLGDLAIRARFGCSVIEVIRNGHSISAPSANFAIFPGDMLLILGEQEHIEAARAYLETKSAAANVDDVAGVLDICRVNNRRAGHTLAELQLAPRTGVRVVGIQRGTERLINPGAEQRLQDGDELLVFGTLPKIRQFRQWLLTGRDGTAVPVP